MERLDVIDKDVWALELELLKELAVSRDEFSSKQLKMEVSTGKAFIRKTIEGAAVPAGITQNEAVTKIVRLGRMLRFLAVSAMPEVFKALSEDRQVRWPESSCFAFFWQGVEDDQCSADSLCSFKKCHAL